MSRTTYSFIYQYAFINTFIILEQLNLHDKHKRMTTHPPICIQALAAATAQSEW